jgi:hypothetical protein
LKDFRDPEQKYWKTQTPKVRFPNTGLKLKIARKIKRTVLQIWHPYQELVEQIEAEGYKRGSFRLMINDKPCTDETIGDGAIITF